MATEWISPTWRMPNDKNQSKFENYSLSFPGINTNQFRLPSTWITDLGLSGATKASMSVWFKPNSTSEMDVVDSYYSNTTNKNLTIKINHPAYPGSLIAYNGSNNTFFNGSNVITVNQWHHVVMVWDASQSTAATKTKAYLNGSLLTNTSSTSFTSIINRDKSLDVSGYLKPFDGEIGELSIFDYAISQDQVNYLYNSGTPINPMAISGQPPVAYYPLGGSSTGSASTLTVPNESVADATVFDFTGASGEYISTNSTNLLDGENEASFSCWIKAKSGIADYDGIITQRSSGGNYFILHVYSVSGSNYKLMLQQNGGGYARQDSGTLQLDRWYHVCVKGTVGSIWNIYVDGQLSNTFATAQNISAIIQDVPLKIGQDYNTRDLVGEMSNVQIWNKDLSTADITTLYNNGVPLLTGTQPQAANLKAWWKMNVDNANWLGSDWQIAEANSAYPQSFDFTGTTGQYIDGGTNILGDESNLSFSFWINPAVVNGNDGVFTISTLSNSQNPLALFLSNNNLRLYINSAYAWQQGFSGRVNEWTHIVVSYDGLNAANSKVYINGVEDAGDGTYNFATGNIDASGAGVKVAIGTYYNANLNLDGKVSNFQIWNTSLSSSQVTELYNNGSPLTTAIASSNLKAWYKLNNNEIWDGTNWSVENQKYPANWENCYNPSLVVGMLRDNDAKSAYSNQSFSISVWVKPKSAVATAGDIFSCKGSSNQGVALFYNSNALTLQIGDKNTTAINSQSGNWSYFNNVVVGASPTYTAYDQWSHIVTVWNGTNTKFYINGTLVQTITPPSSLTIDYSQANTISAIGARNDAGSGYFTGMISNLAYWSSEIDQTSVTALYNNGTPEVSISQSPNHWFTLKDFATGSVDKVGSLNYENTLGVVEFANTFVSTKAGVSSGMTESNLVNNNVSALNGTSSGMTTANLVNSDLTRSIPYSSYSMYFDGTGDEVDFSSSTFGTGLSNFSVSAWAKFDGSSVYECISSVDGVGGRVWQLFQWSSNRGLAFQLFNNSGTGAVTPVNSFINASNTWYHVVGTYDGSNIKLYVDGVLKSTVAQTGTVRASTAENLKIGSNGYNEDLEGNISNVSLYNKALTQAEIIRLYNGGVPSELSTLSLQPNHYWSLGSDSYFNGADWIVPDLVSTLNGTSNGLASSALVGDGPGGSANGTATNMDIPTNLKGNAPNSSSNAFSVNMDTADRVASVPS